MGLFLCLGKNSPVFFERKGVRVELFHDALNLLLPLFSNSLSYLLMSVSNMFPSYLSLHISLPPNCLHLISPDKNSIVT